MTFKGQMPLRGRETDVIGSADLEENVRTGNGMLSPGVVCKAQEDHGAGGVEVERHCAQLQLD